MCNVPGTVRHLLCYVTHLLEPLCIQHFIIHHFSSCAAPTSAALLKTLTYKQTRLPNRLSLTGLVATNSWLLAMAVSEIMVTTELQTKEKNRFLCRVILWQLKLLEKRNKNKWVHGRTAMCTWGQLLTFWNATALDFTNKSYINTFFRSRANLIHQKEESKYI